MARARRVLRPLLRAQLRLRVMAGVVAVTLIALVAFDAGAVAIMRRHLLTQTDSNLRVALDLTRPRLGALLAAGSGPRPGAGGLRAHFSPVPGSGAPELPGLFNMIFLPTRGPAVTLQVAATKGAHGNWTLSPAAARAVHAPGPHTVISPGGRTLTRIQALRTAGGILVVGTSLSQVASTIDQVEIIVVLGSAAVVLLIGLGVFIVLRRGLRPIEAMAGQADRITAGDLTERVAPHSPRSEVGRLGAALNGMLARIEADVDEREASQQQMRHFFADASHELRTPLASLRANAELYQQGALGSTEDVDEVMERIVLETRRMGRLVDDMLRLARLGQQPDRDQEPVDVTAVITGCAERARIAEPGRAWQVRVAAGLIAVGDEELMRRAVDNLLANVLVHTPAGTPAADAVIAAGGQVLIEVSDEGPGVAPGQLPHLFERFYRAGAQPGCPGSGLGLAIAAEIASAHGGTAHAESAAPHGLRITLALPVRRPASGGRAVEPAASVRAAPA
jgi:two-component system OmpR family sensor kinase